MKGDLVMKKLFALAMAIAIMLSAAACGGSKPAAPAAPTAPAASGQAAPAAFE